LAIAIESTEFKPLRMRKIIVEYLGGVGQEVMEWWIMN